MKNIGKIIFHLTTIYYICFGELIKISGGIRKYGVIKILFLPGVFFGLSLMALSTPNGGFETIKIIIL